MKNEVLQKKQKKKSSKNQPSFAYKEVFVLSATPPGFWYFLDQHNDWLFFFCINKKKDDIIFLLNSDFAQILMKSISDIGNNLGIALRDYADSNRKSELSTIACHCWNSN